MIFFLTKENYKLHTQLGLHHKFVESWLHQTTNKQNMLMLFKATVELLELHKN